MDKHLTEILYILDRSGSMQPLAEAAIQGFNDFLAEQQDLPGMARLTLVLFDDTYECPLVSLPASEVTPLTPRNYTIGGSTALLDAMGIAIDELGLRLSQAPEPRRPGTVLVVVFTDGHENASTRFTWTQIQEKIRHQSEVYRWQFLFLGANQDAIATASQMGIAQANAASWVADSVGMASGKAAFRRKASALRRAAAGVVNQETAKDLNEPLQALQDDEDTKRRG